MNSEIFRVGQTYSFMGYDWTACELINKGKTLVIQSHGVTHGEWPGFVMPQFGNSNYYFKSIDGEDISAYDNKMKELYDTSRMQKIHLLLMARVCTLSPKKKLVLRNGVILALATTGRHWRQQRKTPVRSGLPTTMRGLVPSTVAAARGMSTRMAASPTTIRATTMWSRPLLISIYRRLRSLGMRS